MIICFYLFDSAILNNYFLTFESIILFYFLLCCIFVPLLDLWLCELLGGHYLFSLKLTMLFAFDFELVMIEGMG